MLLRLLKNHLEILYVIVWVAIGVIHFFLLKNGFGFNTMVSAADSLVFNVSFGLIGVGLWYMVRFSDLQTRQVRELVIYHLSGLALTILVWVGLDYFILRQVFKSETQYLEFLQDSLTFRIVSGVFYYSLLVTIYYLVINFRELKEKREREARLVSLVKESELNLLRSQIRPHFLFNSLNSISSLTLTDPAKAQEMVIKLSEFMRYSLNLSDTLMSALEKDLYHAGLYLDIEKVRFGDKLAIEKEIAPEALDWQVPAMILQPLLENAIKHGVYESSEKVIVRVEATVEGNHLKIVIGNDVDPEATPRKGTGTGLKNVEARLLNHYGQGQLMSVNKSQHYFEVTLKIPHHVVKDEGTDRR